MGIIGTSRKENEKRVPVHPDHLGEIPADLRTRMVFESGYGQPFGLDDDTLRSMGFALLDRPSILRNCEVVTIAKPVAEDLLSMGEGHVLWGWAHCVQGVDITQAAVDRRLTVVAWEAMNRWDEQGQWVGHVFARNNEMAGYAGVLHAMGQVGIGGPFGPARRGVVIGFGSVGQGAVRALHDHGLVDITVLTPPHARSNSPIAGESHRRFEVGGSGLAMMTNAEGARAPLTGHLAEVDIIVNALLQDPDHPVMYIQEQDVDALRQGCLIIDVSCDAGMGFPFARPTTFERPMFDIGPAQYYAVDHTPSYLWRDASWEISRALLPFLSVVAGPMQRWEQNPTIRRAVEIREGVIENPTILSHQGRSTPYPHAVMEQNTR